MYLLLLISIVLMAILLRIYLITTRKRNKCKPNASKIKHDLREISITFGAKMYDRLRKDNPFKFVPNLFDNTPANGITYNVKYIDTRPPTDTSDTRPLLVLLHGVPGSVDDFAQFVDQFGDKYRIIIPNFPDFEYSLENEWFWHSNDERSEYVLSFLKALAVTDIDCLVCHSGGNPIALQIICDAIDSDLNTDNGFKLKIKSLVMITPPGPKWMAGRQLKYAKALVSVVTSKWKRYLFMFLWPESMSKYVGVPENILLNTTREERFHMTFAAVLSNFEVHMKRWFESLASKKLPTLFVMGERDGLFPKSRFYGILDLMGAKDENYTIIDATGDYESHYKNDEWIKVLNFRSGGHFCYNKFASIFHDEFRKFFAYVMKN